MTKTTEALQPFCDDCARFPKMHLPKQKSRESMPPGTRTRRPRGAFVFAAVAVTMLGWTAAVVHAQSSLPAEAVGASVIAAGLDNVWSLHGPKDATAPLTVFPVAGQPFDRAFHVSVLKQAERSYSIQLLTLTTAPIRKGDVCVCTFYARAAGETTTPGALTVTQVLFEGTEPPAHIPMRRAETLDTAWRKVVMPFVADADYPAGKAKLNFRLGFAPETLDIGGIRLDDYGSEHPLSAFEASPITYAGRDASAAWRSKAVSWIETLRSGKLTVRVVDGRGRPVENAAVRATLTRRAFPWGSVITDEMVSGPRSETADAARWREEFVKYFDSATIGLLTWRWWETPHLKEETLASLAWAQKNRFPDVHGAHLVWTRWDHTPPEVENRYRATAKTDPSRATRELQAAILAHIRDVMTAVRGKVTLWNVINEEVGNHEMADEAGGVPAMIEWFKVAHETDPNAKLIVNDDGILTFGGADIGYQDKEFALIKALKDGGAPITGIGFECHFDAFLPPPTRIHAILDRFATLGLPIYITEFDTKLDDAQLQADFTRDFLLTIYSHPAVAGFTMWDFWDGVAWKGDAPLYNKDWTLKPSGQVFLDLVGKQWTTDATGTTTANGVYPVSGSLGDYAVTATTPSGRTASAHASLTATGTTVTLHLPMTTTTTENRPR